MAEREGLSLGQLLLTLDRTMVTLVEAPRGLDMPVGSVALVDIDDVRLGLAVGAGSADLFFLLGVSDAEAVGWIAEQVRGADSGSKSPAAAAPRPCRRIRQGALACGGETSRGTRHRGGRGGTARPLGVALQAGQPRVRAPRRSRRPAQRLRHRSVRAGPVDRRAHPRDDQHRGRPVARAGLFGLQRGGRRTAQADDPRPAGPPEHLEWIGQWGIFDALQASGDVVRIAERPELGLRPRLAVAIHLPATDARRPPPFAGTIWLQQGSAPLADDAEEVLRGGAVLAARIMSRLSAAPSAHTVHVQSLLGLGEDSPDIGAIAQELGIAVDGRVALVGFGAEGTSVPANVIALSASAFRADAQVASTGERVYVLLPKVGATSSLTSWVRGIVAALHRELGLTMRAVIAAPLSGLAAAATARAEVDRVFDSADRHPGAIGQVTSLDEAHTTVLLDEIVAHVAGQNRLIDPRVRELREQDPMLAETLAAYLDGFGDIAAVAQRLHVHPNTVRYRIRRIEKLLSTSLGDPENRLVLALGLRATEPS